MLPRLPQSSITTGAANTNGINVLGVMTKRINAFLAPVRRQRAEKKIGLACTADTNSSPSRQIGPEARDDDGPLTPPDNPVGKGEAMSMSRWYSVEKNLCESCWALRTGASAVGGSRCQRCGHTHRRGYFQDVSKPGGGGDKTVNAAPWQQFGQVGWLVVVGDVLAGW